MKSASLPGFEFKIAKAQFNQSEIVLGNLLFEGVQGERGWCFTFRMASSPTMRGVATWQLSASIGVMADVCSLDVSRCELSHRWVRTQRIAHIVTEVASLVQVNNMSH